VSEGMNDLTHRQDTRSMQKVDPTDRLYIALDSYDFSFFPSEIAQVRALWKTGCAVPTIAKEINREVEEVFVLLLDQVLKFKIKAREGGIWAGSKMPLFD